MGDIPEGAPCLILAHRPFEARHAFTETGPIFLCAKTCKRAKPCETVPETLRAKQFTRRSYDHAERIIYGTGKIVPTWEIAREIRKMLAELKAAFVDVRSASNNCFQCRIERS